VALDAESRLVLAVVPGRRTEQSCRLLVEQTHRRTRGRTDVLLCSDAHEPYREAIQAVYGQAAPEGEQAGGVAMPEELCYATVRKRRVGGRVVEVLRAVVFGTWALLTQWLVRSTVSTTVNTAFVERNNGTDRRRNGRKHRKTYGFSKDRQVHESLSYFVSYSYNFCWPVRTLRQRVAERRYRQRTPAMAAGLADQVWTLEEWLTYPAKHCEP
jgi:IS1 family transposase